MISPTTQEVFLISDHFDQLGIEIGKYIELNKSRMTLDEKNRLYDAEIDLTRLAGRINMIGVDLVFEDVKEMLLQLDVITKGVQAAVKKALAVQDAIKIAAGLVTIGTAILSGDPKSIVQTTIDFGKSLPVK